MTCEQAYIAEGFCEPQIGCDKVTTGDADKALCVALRECMLTKRCWGEDPFDCFCGTAKGVACLTGANGPCAEETMRATRATGFTDAGTRFYDFAFPAGFATQQIGCRKDYCGPAALAPHTNACPL